MQMSIGERWVRWVAKYAATQSKYLPLFWIAFAVVNMIFALMALGWANSASAMGWFMIGGLFLVIALVHFERRHFALIIEEQEQRIAQLEGRTQPLPTPAANPNLTQANP